TRRDMDGRPGALTDTRYSPVPFGQMIEYSPVPLVVVACCARSGARCARTVAPETGRPLSVVTRPRMISVRVCARAGRAALTTSEHAERSRSGIRMGV